MKVIIADDEAKVCRLIQFLVDWDALGMEVVGIVHNGIDALELIKECKPDITITDIRMPGCSGLTMIEQARELAPEMQYIIISGYRDFEYAHKAIQFGVSNYLLKPIDEKELLHTLEKMKNTYLEKTEQLTKEEKLRNLEIGDKHRCRIHFLEEIIMRRKAVGQAEEIQAVNNLYKYQFQEGVFQTAIIKVDGIFGELKTGTKYIDEKIRQALKKNLNPCFDWECKFEHSSCYVVMNYSFDYKDIRKDMRKVLEELLLQENVFKQIQFTIGMGEKQELCKMLSEGYKAASWAVAQRLIEGCNQIINGKCKNANTFVEGDLFKQFNKKFSNAIELQDISEIEKALLFLETEIIRWDGITGYETLQMTKEAMNAYLFGLKKSGIPMDSVSGLFEEFNMAIEDYGTIQEVLAYLRKTICKNFEKVLSEKKHMDTRPIREAKKYISLHYAEPISLEIVSEVVGFNSTYFSSMFKKEIGISFSEYLLNLRMEKTKEFLKESKKSIAAICEEVGYSDVKHFTKKFTQHTGLKPNEFRKLYS